THDAVNNDTTLARDLIPALLAALADLRVVVLTGMRQTGKSTLLTSTKGLSGRRYATLEAMMAARSASLAPPRAARLAPMAPASAACAGSSFEPKLHWKVTARGLQQQSSQERNRPC